ncbi:unnamed protein product [Rodentolepis nana]|uniref:NET domain-containing protein n=1 Tax=Rodentolepis nana TaxID=102285 RepID=A0A0R3TGQ8_RODNA|nr:unnamed protein product [Rodentolepis nana]
MFSMNMIVELEKCRQLVEELRSSKYAMCNFMFQPNYREPRSNEKGLNGAPSNLEEIRKKLQRRKYYDKEDFAVDVRRMCKVYRDNKRNPRLEREISREFEATFEREFAEKFGCQRMSYDEIDDLANKIKKLSKCDFDCIINILKNNEPQCQGLSRPDIKRMDLRYMRDSTLDALKSYVIMVEEEKGTSTNCQNQLSVSPQGKENLVLTEAERESLFERILALPNEDKLHIIKLITDNEFASINLKRLNDSTVLKMRDYVYSLQRKEEEEEKRPFSTQKLPICRDVDEPGEGDENFGNHDMMEWEENKLGSNGFPFKSEEPPQSFNGGIGKQRRRKPECILKAHN